jgi:hypothetical protein
MNEVKLNKAQRQYLEDVLYNDSSIKTFKHVKSNYALCNALMVLDKRGYLIDDYTEAVEQFINAWTKNNPVTLSDDEAMYIGCFTFKNTTYKIFIDNEGYQAQEDGFFILKTFKTLDALYFELLTIN